MSFVDITRKKNDITGNSSQWEACLSTRKKGGYSKIQWAEEWTWDKRWRDGSKNIIENGKGHRKLLKLKQVA